MTLILALAVLLTTAGATFAQEMSSTAAIATVIAKQKPGDKTADGLRKEIVRLKYVRAIYIKDFLYPFASREGHVVSNPETPDILALSDLPENIEKMLAAIREIDVKPADVLFTVQLVLGSETEDKTDAELQSDTIIKELRKLLRYKGYTFLDSTLVRGLDRYNAEIMLGRKAEFQLELRPEVAREKPQDNIKVELRLRQISETFVTKDGKQVQVPKESILIRNQLNLKSGDKAVVGVSKLDGGDKGLILIVSAKVVE